MVKPKWFNIFIHTSRGILFFYTLAVWCFVLALIMISFMMLVDEFFINID